MGERRPYILGLAAVFVVILTVVYWNHFDNEFHFDDDHTIVNNIAIRDISNLPEFFLNAGLGSTIPTNQDYRPVVAALNAFDYWLADGLNVNVFHWHIYLEFLMLLGLLFLFFRKVMFVASGEQHELLALFATAFFGLHTATAETVNYVIARSDGFSTLMIVAGVVAFTYLQGLKRHIALVALILGCLAKLSALMLAPVLFLYVLLLEKPSWLVVNEHAGKFEAWLRAVKMTWPYFWFAVVLYVFVSTMYGKDYVPSDSTTLQYLNTQPYVMWLYLKTFFWPVTLTADSDLMLFTSYLSPEVLFGALAIAVMLSIAFIAARYRSGLPITFGILWFYIALLPTSSLVPLAEVMNHHRTFFPYIGLVLASTWAAHLFARHWLSTVSKANLNFAGSIFAVLILVAHAIGTYSRNEVWDTERSLWYDVTRKSPENGRGLMNFGLTLMAENQMDGAIYHFKKALDTPYGRHPYLFTNLAIATDALAIRNNDVAFKKQAEEYFKKGIEYGTIYPVPHYRYALWLYNNGRTSEALVVAKKAVSLGSSHLGATSLLATLEQLFAKQIRSAKQFAKSENSPEALLDLSLKYYQAGDFRACIDASEQALELKPYYTFAYNNICSAYNQLGQYQNAIDSCQSALKIDPTYQLAKGNLDWAKQRLSSQ